MAPIISSAKVTLDYPLYACAFDTEDANRLIVGGGGGAGRSGVGNKITILDTSNPNELIQTGEIDLSKEEDNVTSLAVGRRSDGETFILAGVNSGPKDLKEGKNSHFRVFGVEDLEVKEKEEVKEGEKPKPKTKIEEVSRSRLFQVVEKDAYQRITRLSRPTGNTPQLGAVTTGLAKKSEIVFFDTSSLSPPKSRGALRSNKECVDVDFIQTGKDTFRMAYCDEYDIYLKDLGPEESDESPECVYIMPASRTGENPTIPKFRAMRFLTKDLICMLLNIHSNSGAVIQILRNAPGVNGKCTLAQSIRLPKYVSKATSLAVVNLTPPRTPEEKQGYTQFVVAVASQDVSISLFKVDLQVEVGVEFVSSLQPFRTFKNLHPFNISGIAFSNYSPPALPITGHTPRQVVKLASVGVANTVVVHTIPLFPVPLSVQRGQSKSARYVVAFPDKSARLKFSVGFACILAVLVGLLVQGVLEIRGRSRNVLGWAESIPIVFQEAIGRPYVFPEGYDGIVTETVTGSVRTTTVSVALESGSAEVKGKGKGFWEGAKESAKGGLVVLEHSDEGGVKAVVGEKGKGGKKWEDLAEGQKRLWKKALKEAGHWVEGTGEAVLKGFVFSEIAGAVAGAVGEL